MILGPFGFYHPQLCLQVLADSPNPGGNPPGHLGLRKDPLKATKSVNNAFKAPKPQTNTLTPEPFKSLGP